MKDENIVLKCDYVSKVYKVWRDESSRLKASIWSLLGRAFKQNENPYYRSFQALEDISFNMREGESLGIIGRNGSGKSTLLQILAGTLQPTTGSIWTNGRVAALLELGSGFNPEFTGRENVYIYGSILGYTKAETSAIFDTVIEFSELEDFIDQPLKTYSSGMMIRLAFSVRIHLDPDILIIDEALAVGDYYFVQKCTRYIRNFIKNKTLVLVTHDLSAVQNLCDRCIWLKNGRIAFDGSPKDAVEKYLSHYNQSLNHFPEKTETENSDNQTDLNIKIQNNKATEEYYDQRKADYGNQFRIDWDVVLLNEPTNSYGTGEGTITKCWIEDDKGSILSGIVGGELVCLNIRAKANTEIRDPIIGFNLKDRLGQYIFGDNTYLANLGRNLVLSKSQEVIAKFEFRMPTLHPAQYAFAIAFAKGTQENHTQIHWLHEAILIQSESPVTHQGLCGIPMLTISTIIE